MAKAFSLFLNVCVWLLYRALKSVSHKPCYFMRSDLGNEADALYTRLCYRHRLLNAQSFFLTAVASSCGSLLVGVIVVGEPLVMPRNSCFHIRHAIVTYFGAASVTNLL